MSKVPFKIIKNRFNTNRSKLRQIFCLHKWDLHRDLRPELNTDCYYEQCEKCGKFKVIEYYKWRK